MSAAAVPAAGRPRAGHTQSREQILRVATALAVHGESPAIGLRELARAVGIAPQSIYTYFTSKHDLYDALTIDAADELRTRLHQAAQATGADATDGPVRAVTQAFLEFGADQPALFQLLFLHPIPHYQPNASGRAAVDRATAVLGSTLLRVGIVEPDATNLYTSVLIGWVARNASTADRNPPARRLNQLVTVLTSGLLNSYAATGIPPALGDRRGDEDGHAGSTR